MKKKTSTTNNKTAKKTTAQTKLQCSVCGMIVAVDPATGCTDYSNITCCGSPMEQYCC